MHNYLNKSCTVSILLPPSVRMLEASEPEKNGLPSKGAHLFNEDEAEAQFRAVEALKEMISDTAKQCHLIVQLYERQLHDEPDQAHVMHHRERVGITDATELFVTVDPTPDQLSFASVMKNNHILRSIAAFTNREVYERALLLASVQKLPTFEKSDGQRRGISRIYPMFLSPNEEEEADDRLMNSKIVRTALLYPHVNSFIQKIDVNSLMLVDADNRVMSLQEKES